MFQYMFLRPVQDTFKKYLDTDTFKKLTEKSRYRYCIWGLDTNTVFDI